MSDVIIIASILIDYLIIYTDCVSVFHFSWQLLK